MEVNLKDFVGYEPKKISLSSKGRILIHKSLSTIIPILYETAYYEIKKHPNNRVIAIVFYKNYEDLPLETQKRCFKVHHFGNIYNEYKFTPALDARRLFEAFGYTFHDKWVEQFEVQIDTNNPNIIFVNLDKLIKQKKLQISK